MTLTQKTFWWVIIPLIIIAGVWWSLPTESERLLEKEQELSRKAVYEREVKK